MSDQSTAAAQPATAQQPVTDQFEFDDAFQLKIAAMSLRDSEFLRRSALMLKPEFFVNEGLGQLVAIALNHFQKYNCAPDNASLIAQLKDRIANRSIRKELVPMVVQAAKDVQLADLSNRQFVEEKLVDFSRTFAMKTAILKSVDLLNKGKVEAIHSVIEEALAVGINEDGAGYDFFAHDRIQQRTVERIEKVSGVLPPQGISTGDARLDGLLYHRGWGRKELYAFLGGPKSGKTTALIHFGRIASWLGFNVLYATLEVGAKIIADRFDASLTDTMMKELGVKANDVAQQIQKISQEAGQLRIHEYGTGTLTGNQLRNLIQSYKRSARNPDGTVRPPITFDLIIVDYADIMAPNYRTNDPIENSKQIWVDLRAIAFEENAAVLTATQSNRDGSKQTVAKAEHVADDFNKVRIVDLLISINKTEEERQSGEARLYFAASRNQEAGFTIVVKQDLARMKFIEKVLRVD